MAIQKALKTLCYVNGCGSVAIESAQIHVETGGAVARQLLDAPSLYNIVRRRAANACSRSVRLKNEKKKKPRRGESIAKFLARCQARCCDGSHIFATALALRRRWILHLLKTIRSDRGWKLKEPLVALPLPVPLAPLPPLPPLALLLPMPLLPLLVQFPPLLLQLSFLLPPMALLVESCRTRACGRGFSPTAK